MKIIKRRMYLYICFCTLGVAASMPIFFSSAEPGRAGRPLLVFLLSAAFLAAALALREGRRLSAARLIVENQFLHIESSAVLETHTGKCYENAEAFVSCFGLLFDSKIIKFNQDGIRLKAVEIGRNCLSLDYGTDTITRSVRLEHTVAVNDRLEDIIEKFRYETGIIPALILEKE